MDITRHLVKPVEVEILGEKTMMKPLRTKHSIIVSEFAYLYSKAKSFAEYNEKNPDKPQKELSREERRTLTELELELSFLTLKEMDPNLTREKFDELPPAVTNVIMAKFWEINNPNTGEYEKAKKELIDE